MRKSTKHLFTALLFIGCLAGCNQTTTSEQENTPSTEGSDYDSTSVPWSHPADTLDMDALPSDEDIGLVLRDSGYSNFRFERKSVIVDNDMVFHRSDFLSKPIPETPALGKVSQRAVSLRAIDRVSRHKAWRVYIHPNLPPNWKYGAVMALNQWRIWGKFRFTFTDNLLSADIEIVPTHDLPDRVIAVASFPRINMGIMAPGNFIKVNVKNYRNVSNLFTLGNMLHEYGHCFGFTHTNSKAGKHIPGTFKKDKYSIMNSFYIDWIPGAATPSDLEAIRYMYP